MTREDDLHEAWDDFADAEAEHDQAHAARAWERVRQLQEDGHDVVPGQATLAGPRVSAHEGAQGMGGAAPAD